MFNFILQSAIYFSSWEDKFLYNNMGEMVDSSGIDQTSCYSYRVSIDLYNSSSSTKIMRNIRFVFKNDREQLKEFIPKDDNTARHNGPVVFYDEIGSINIPPKTVINLRLHGGDWSNNGELDYIWKTNQIYLTYLNEYNKVKSLKVKSEDYSAYFKNHMKDN